MHLPAHVQRAVDPAGTAHRRDGGPWDAHDATTRMLSISSAPTSAGLTQADPAPPAAATPAVRATATTTDVARTVTQINDMEASPATVGLSFADFTGIQTRDAVFLGGVQTLLAEQHPAPEVPAPAPATRTTSREDRRAERLTYAATTAQVSSSRDRAARDTGSETAYMYLSHDIDVRIDPTTVATGALSNQYEHYAGWIGDDDRRVYDSFLRLSRNLRLGEDLRAAASR
ncbi:MAG TPA: hypothetical protein VGC57_15730 [Cellulomonas sp.]